MEFPDLRLQLYDTAPGEQLELMKEGKLDIAIIGQDMVQLAADFYQRKAAKLGVCVVLPDTHAQVDKNPLSLSDLAGEWFVGVSEQVVPGRNHWIQHLCKQAGFKTRFLTHTRDVSETITLVVSEGAVALLPDYLEGAAPPGVVYRPLADEWASWDMYVLRQRGQGSDASKRLFSIFGKC